MDTSGTYTSAERVEREGRLVAFAGETMTMVEAARRGLAVAEDEGGRGRKPGAKAASKAATARKAVE
ncbi:hypothetical protein [Eggerthella sinensis]|uniref:Uncharacterized protein n=1 Tax=Eggerthella sinensis TaxID=242230 RepID=A0A3N0IUV6_9ACTN|nr:hypothetical protein [Eggerthella sinensis]RDB70673.1 hypothetical protein C1876_02875 [Eggerthella sinensis]RNM40781.1 hypothetical protein DMP09_12810 [Eggerthella sinensis]